MCSIAFHAPPPPCIVTRASWPGSGGVGLSWETEDGDISEGNGNIKGLETARKVCCVMLVLWCCLFCVELEEDGDGELCDAYVWCCCVLCGAGCGWWFGGCW